MLVPIRIFIFNKNTFTSSIDDNNIMWKKMTTQLILQLSNVIILSFFFLINIYNVIDNRRWPVLFGNLSIYKFRTRYIRSKDRWYVISQLLLLYYYEYILYICVYSPWAGGSCRSCIRDYVQPVININKKYMYICMCFCHYYLICEWKRIPTRGKQTELLAYY